MRRSTHNLSHHHLLTTDMGYLVPTCCMEVLPGDTFRGSTSVLVRVAPLANPVMHPVEVRLHNWYVPNRIIYSPFNDWIAGNEEASSVDPPTHTLTGDPMELALADHLGIPPYPGVTVSRLPFMAYSKIWSEFYRDQDLQAPLGTGGTLGLTLQRICWEKDYFTVARNEAAIGSDIKIPFSVSQAPVTGIGVRTTDTANDAGAYKETGGDAAGAFFNLASDVGRIAEDPDNPGYPGVYAQLGGLEGGGIDINDFRRAMALQQWAERRARFGDRGVDLLRFLGINPSDARHDRPEYIGGGKQTVSFSEVLATAEGSTTNVGDMYGHGLAALRTRRFSKMFEEHGWFIQLLSVRPKTMYQDHLPRKFTRFGVMDYWQKELEAAEPWQPVYQSEVHWGGDPATVFGWQSRYEEYRHEVSYVSGNFRGGPEQDWHMARTFANPPTLNSSFVECTPTDRIYQDQNMPELMVNTRHDITARRIIRQNAII